MVMCVGCGSDRDEQYNGNIKVLVVMMVMITVMGLGTRVVQVLYTVKNAHLQQA